jgi:hypothetical protein
MEKIPDDVFPFNSLFLTEFNNLAVTNLSDCYSINSANLLNSFQFDHQLPIITPSYNTHNLLQAIKKGFDVLVTKPISVWENNISIVSRIRWLLLIYHFVVYFKLRNEEKVGIDLLISAFDLIDTIYYSNQTYEINHVYVYDYVIKLLYSNAVKSDMSKEIIKSLYGSVFSTEW